MCFRSSPPFQVTEVNASWVQQFGFGRDEVVGSSIEGILQGELTEPNPEVDKLMEAVRQRRAHATVLTNYSKSGVVIRNDLRIWPNCDGFVTQSRTSPVLPQDLPSLLFNGTKPFQVVDVNNAWLRQHNLKREEVVGSSAVSIMQGELAGDSARVATLMAAVHMGRTSHVTVLADKSNSIITELRVYPTLPGNSFLLKRTKQRNFSLCSILCS